MTYKLKNNPNNQSRSWFFEKINKIDNTFKQIHQENKIQRIKKNKIRKERQSYN